MISADIRLCSITDLDIAPESVDAIICDPPYPREFLPLWGDLAQFAARALKPGGNLLAMSGHMYLPDVVSHLGSSGLSYRWTIACMTPGANVRVWPVKMLPGWKPIFWYAKGATTPKWITEDRLVSRPDKRFHEWGQDVVVFESLVRLFTDRGDLVCDPFLGGGTTAVAAMLNGRRIVGCDVDERCIASTTARLKAVSELLEGQRSLVSAG